MYTIKRNYDRLGGWTLVFNGKTTYHFRKSEAVARAQRLVRGAAVQS